MPYGLNGLFSWSCRNRRSAAAAAGGCVAADNSQSAKLICGFWSPGQLSVLPFFLKPEFPILPASKLGDFAATRPDTAVVPAEHARCPASAKLGNRLLRPLQGRAASLLTTIEGITLGCFSPERHAGQFGRMQGLRRKGWREPSSRPQVAAGLLSAGRSARDAFRLPIRPPALFTCTACIHTCRGKFETARNSHRKARPHLLSCGDSVAHRKLARRR